MRLGNSQWVQSATAFSTLAGTASCPVPTFAGRRKIWTGVLTMGDFAQSFPARSFRGYHPNPESGDGGGLDPATFTLGLRDYEVGRIALGTSGASGLNFIAGQGQGEWWDSTVLALRLHVCNTNFDFSDSGYGYADENPIVIESNHLWTTDLDWSGVTTRTVHMSLPLNRPATGAPLITGPATVGQELAVDVTGIEDEDGLHDVEYTYQWVRVDADGTSNEEDITDATAATYTLTDDDLGKKVKIEVSFPDDFGSDEQRTSAPTDTVTAASTNNAPVFTPSDVSRSIAENPDVAGQNIGDPVTATDADAGDTLGYTLGGDDAASFDIIPSSGQIRTQTNVSYSILDFEAKSTYTVTVTATDTSNATAVATVTISVTDVDEPPSAPATPAVSAVSGSTTSLTVSWAAPANAGKPAIDSYDVQYRAGTSGTWSDGPEDVPGTSTTIASLVADTLYEVQVRATNAEGNSVLWSDPPGSGRTNSTTETVPGVTVSKTALTVTEEDTTGAGYTVVLDSQPTANVTVTVAGHAGTDVTPSPTSLTFTTTTWGTAQTVTVTAGHDADTANDAVTLTHSATSTDSAYDAIAIGGVTVTVEDNDTAPPPPVTGLAQVMGVGVAPGNARLVVNWTAVDTATGYTVQWMSGGGGLQHQRPAGHGHVGVDHALHDSRPHQRHGIHGAGDCDPDGRQRRPALGRDDGDAESAAAAAAGDEPCAGAGGGGRPGQRAPGGDLDGGGHRHGLHGAVDVGRTGLQQRRPAGHGHDGVDHALHDSQPYQRHGIHGAGDCDPDGRQRRPALGRDDGDAESAAAAAAGDEPCAGAGGGGRPGQRAPGGDLDGGGHRHGLHGAVDVGRTGLQQRRPAGHGHVGVDHALHDSQPYQRHGIHGAGDCDPDGRQRRPALGRDDGDALHHARRAAAPAGGAGRRTGDADLGCPAERWRVRDPPLRGCGRRQRDLDRRGPRSGGNGHRPDQRAAVRLRGAGDERGRHTASPVTTPGAPQHLSAVPGYEQVTLTWDAPSSDGGSAILRYEVAVDDSGTWIDAGLDLEETVTGLTNGQRYTFAVRARHRPGGGGDSSPATTPGAPQHLSAVPGYAQVTLTWDAPTSDGGSAILRYEVAVDDSGTWIDAGLDLEETVTGLTNGQRYTFAVRAVNAAGTGPAATVTIVTSHPLAQAWLARFGRAATDHVVDAVSNRWQGGPQASHLTIGGVQTGALFGWIGRVGQAARDTADDRGDPVRTETSWTRLFAPSGAAGTGGGGTGPGMTVTDRNTGPVGGGGVDRKAGATLSGRAAQGALLGALGLPDPRALTDLRAALLGSSFFYSGAGDEDGQPRTPGRFGEWSAWGRGAASWFSGTDSGLSLDGEVVTAMLGFDSRWERWLAGVVVSHSRGQGTYAHPTATGGAVASSLTALHPYAGYKFNERTSIWGVLGYGVGEMSLTPERSVTALETGLMNAMAAVGGRMALSVRSGPARRFELAIRSDARLTNTAADGVGAMAGAAGQTHRVRMMLEGSGVMPLASGGVLKPRLEAGLRYDAGDAETGAGLEVGGGLGYAFGRLSLEVNARGLLAHRDTQYEEWGFSGAVAYTPSKDGRGVSLRLGSGWGATQSGVQSLWRRQDASDLVRHAEFDAAQRYQVELRYGLDGLKGRVRWTPYIGVDSVGGSSQALRLGVTLTSGRRFDAGLELGRRQGGPGAGPEHAGQIRATLLW